MIQRFLLGIIWTTNIQALVLANLPKIILTHPAIWRCACGVRWDLLFCGRQLPKVERVVFSSVWTEEGVHRAWVGGAVRKVKVTVVQNKHFERVPKRIRELLGRVESCFPEPENTASGARETIRHGYNPTQLRPLAGGWGMSDTEVKLSASAVLGLLAGAVTQEELFRTLGFRPQSTKPSAIRNPFDYMLSRKMRLHEIVVEETAHDDSYLVFRFEGRDPALSSFVNPKA